MFCVAVNAVHEFYIDGADRHPLHLHVHPMQLICGDSTRASPGFVQMGDFVDVLYGDGNCGPGQLCGYHFLEMFCRR